MEVLNEGMQRSALELLREMLQIYSPSGQEGAITEYLVERMAALGMQASVDEAGNVVGSLGSGTRTIVLLGHIDTVPGEIPVRVEENRLYGRGAVDAKGPFATFITAAALNGPPADARLIIIGAVDEEGGSAGARYVVDRYSPQFAIIGEPSGWRHVTLGYKGSLSFDYHVHCETSHSAGAGICAPEEAIAFWNRLLVWTEEFNRGKERLFEQVTPTLRAINTTCDGFTDKVTMSLNLRWPLGMDLPGLESWLRDAAEPASLVFTNREVPYRSEKRNKLVGAFLASIRRAGGLPGFKLKTGTSDMNIVGPAWGCPMVAYGPGDSGLDHTPNEHIVLEEYFKAIEVLGYVLPSL